jgi:glycosyltransferase involved in cell wall biosynthesis
MIDSAAAKKGRIGVDVVIPVYNCETFVAKAIESVVEQTYQVERIIVVDDGSTDSSGAIVLDLCKKYDGLIQYFKKPNGGPSSARNWGIARCRADLIAFLDSDDVWAKNKLERQLTLWKASPFEKLGVVYCAYDLIDGNGNQIHDMHIIHPREELRGKIFGALLRANLICGSDSGVLVGRECFEKVGVFDESLHGAEDWDMWLRIAREYCFDYATEPLVSIRLHARNAQKDIAKMVSNDARFVDKWISAASGEYAGIRREWRRMLTSMMMAVMRDSSLKGVRLPMLRRMKLFPITFGSVRLYVAMKLILDFLFTTYRETAGRTKGLLKSLRALAR